LADMGLKQISLADTVGMATPDQISSLVAAAIRQAASVDIGIHLHAAPGEEAAKIAAAYQAGCRRFDMAIGGQGGCPFAQDALVGNIDTEAALAELAILDARLPLLRPRGELLTMSRAIAARFGPAMQ
jgi:hydroxymethylglutaryl-CoA lyase